MNIYNVTLCFGCTAAPASVYM